MSWPDLVPNTTPAADDANGLVTSIPKEILLDCMAPTPVGREYISHNGPAQGVMWSTVECFVSRYVAQRFAFRKVGTGSAVFRCQLKLDSTWADVFAITHTSDGTQGHMYDLNTHPDGDPLTKNGEFRYLIEITGTATLWVADLRIWNTETNDIAFFPP